MSKKKNGQIAYILQQKLKIAREIFLVYMGGI